MDKRHLFSVGALGVMVFFAFGSVSGDTETAFDVMEETMEDAAVEAVAEEAVAADASGTGIAACDEYLKRYRCFLGKLGGDTSAADMAEKSFKDSLSQVGDGPGSDMVKKAVADSCTQAVGSIESQFADQGC